MNKRSKTNAILSRFCSAWVGLAEELVTIISLGFISPSWKLKFITFWIKTHTRNKKRREDWRLHGYLTGISDPKNASLTMDRIDDDNLKK